MALSRLDGLSLDCGLEGIYTAERRPLLGMQGRRGMSLLLPRGMSLGLPRGMPSHFPQGTPRHFQ